MLGWLDGYKSSALAMAPPAMAAAEQPNLILMDLNLPEIHGGEPTRRLKAGPATFLSSR